MSEQKQAPGTGEARVSLPHASERLTVWLDDWRESGKIVLLLDFDGTLAPIVERPEQAGMPAETRAALEQLAEHAGVEIAIVSGRGLADARDRVGLPEIAYAGNHGMEIEGPGVHQVHEEAAAARPQLEAVISEVSEALRDVPGALVEDKGLTLSIHYRLVDRARVGEVRGAVDRAVTPRPGLRLTEGKEVLEVRPRVDWHKGRAVEFLLTNLEPAPGVPILYLGDDTTDEDAFRALRSWKSGAGEGVLVDPTPPEGTAARAWLRDPGEVGELLGALADRAPR